MFIYFYISQYYTTHWTPYRYKQNKKYHFSSSSFWSTESEELNHQDKEQNHQNDIEHESNNLESFDDSDIDFWL